MDGGPLRWVDDSSAKAEPTVLDRIICGGSLGALTILSISLIALKVASIPVRALLVVAFLSLFSLIYPEETRQAITRHKPTIWMAIGLGALGLFVSLANTADFHSALWTLMEVHLQVVLTLLFATVAADKGGSRLAAMVVIGVIGATAFVATLQFIGLDWAWQVRDMLKEIQKDPRDDFDILDTNRALGLSYSPIQLATQICLAFAAFGALRATKRRPMLGKAVADPGVVIAALVLAALSIVCETRSPLLGAGVFLVVYAAYRQNVWLAILISLGGILSYVAGPQLIDSLRSADLRVARVDDDSAVGRISLVRYGILLFLDNPLGYGFDFEPSEHWQKFWHSLYTMQSADDIQTKDLHNYFLNMMNTYGVGLILFIPSAYKMIYAARYVIIYFMPYVIHITVHNAGPFWNDAPLWFVLGAISSLLHNNDSANGSSVRKVNE